MGESLHPTSNNKTSRQWSVTGIDTETEIITYKSAKNWSSYSLASMIWATDAKEVFFLKMCLMRVLR